MWQRIDDERLTREVVGRRQSPYTVADAGRRTEHTTDPVVARRWVHDDGRYAMHLADGRQPALLVLDVEGERIEEYSLPAAAKLDELDPLHGAVLVRAVGATLADDAPTPDAEAGRWALLRGWY